MSEKWTATEKFWGNGRASHISQRRIIAELLPKRTAKIQLDR